MPSRTSCVREAWRRLIAHHAAHAHGRKNDATARHGLEQVEHAFAQAPAMHEEALEAEGVCARPIHSMCEWMRLISCRITRR